MRPVLGFAIVCRGDRRDVVVFVAHGSGAEKVGAGSRGMLCGQRPHGDQVARREKSRPMDDGAALKKFARSLPPGSMLRHHVAGDMEGRCNV